MDNPAVDVELLDRHKQNVFIAGFVFETPRIFMIRGNPAKVDQKSPGCMDGPMAHRHGTDGHEPKQFRSGHCITNSPYFASTMA